MLAPKLLPSRCRRSGAVLIKLAICLPALVGIVALNLDGGRMMDERRLAQAAADAAALAAGGNLYETYWTNYGTDPAGSAQLAAQQIAAANGYPASAVTVNIPPQSGTYAGQAGYVEVIIETTLQASFGQIFTGSGLGVAARSVSRGEPVRLGIILLRSTGAGAFQNNAVTFALINKPLIVNSSDPLALESGGLVMLSLSRISTTGGASITSVLPVNVSVKTGVQPTLDPLAFLPVPDQSTATVQSLVPLTVSSPLPTVLQPGIYKGGIRLTGASVVVMSPGVYIMQGGGFHVDGAATVTGLSTMVYNTTSTSYASGPISVAGLGKVVMTAPLSGTYQGLNFFQDRSLTQPVSISGVGLTTITGTVYAAQAPVNLTGSAAVGLDILGGAYVASTMTVGGVGAVTINLGLNPPRIPDVRIVE
jgi:Flp pilus assembly protein TadG